MNPATDISAAATQLVVATAELEPDPGSGMGHGAMAGCILFLAVGAAGLLLALLRGYRTSEEPRDHGLVGVGGIHES